MNKKQMKEFMKALNTIVEEKGIDRQIVIEAMEQAKRPVPIVVRPKEIPKILDFE